MHKMNAGVRSTKVPIGNKKPAEKDAHCPTKKQKKTFVCVIDIQDELAQQSFTDQTGRFPTTSSQGNQYIMAMAQVDSNTILMEPMRNRIAGEMVRTWKN